MRKTSELSSTTSTRAIREKWECAAAVPIVLPEAVSKKKTEKEKVYILPPRNYHSKFNGVPYDINAGMPQSIRMMADMMLDIAAMKYGANPDETFYEYVFSEDNNEHILDFVHVCNSEKTGMNYGNADSENFAIDGNFFLSLREMLAEIDAENTFPSLKINPGNLCLIFDNKTHLLDVLANYVEEDKRLTTPDILDLHVRLGRKYKKDGANENQWLRERVTRASEVATANEDEQDIYRHVYLASAQAKPYLSLSHYKAAAMVSSVATLVQNFHHIIKTIYFEDKLEPSPEVIRSMFFGGYQ